MRTAFAVIAMAGILSGCAAPDATAHERWLAVQKWATGASGGTWVEVPAGTPQTIIHCVNCR